MAAQPATAQAPKPNEVLEDPNLLVQTYVPTPAPKPADKRQANGFHYIRAERQISPDALKGYLESKRSPLAGYADSITRSPYYSTIIGICTIEQYSCTRAPSFNYWGLMGKNGLQKFPNMESGIAAIDAFLAKAESNGRTTIESFRGWYCASACTNWESTVLRTKEAVESL